ncbi:MAG: uroporphyrinogen-III synthase [Kangiellaceae bacterium]|jgi:uroporphyrinogen-III synthase|nr:uroporphyrinogen-III synthase [Kangiellaceae bacterium]
MSVYAITRPVAQAHSLTQALSERDIKVIECPLIAISAKVSEVKESWLQQNKWIFVSENAAVNAHIQLSESQWQALSERDVFAIGSATAGSLKQRGIDKVVYPVQANSESFLQLTELNHVAQQSFTLVCGKGGRDLIENTLRSRSAIVERFETYQRDHAVIDEKLLMDAFKQNARWIISSSFALQYLSQLANNHQRSGQLSVIVSSERLRLDAAALNMKVLAVASGATTTAIVDCICQLEHHRKYYVD